MITSFLKHQVDTGENVGLLNCYPAVSAELSGQWCVRGKVSDVKSPLETICKSARKIVQENT